MSSGADTKEAVKEVDICKFETKCINQAAWLWCYDEVELLELVNETDRPSVILFVFSVEMSSAALSALIFKYANEKSSVEPVSFVNNQNKLRDLRY